ncbi:LOW QUALITY PROTEIN: macrosialin [Hippoglossus stenolepis]|uniref:LOW QUALITY PROTEIN: macrosialin n=1 Tax=Hippoglossus stenolepis TaxID=195615 RepID=UPI001FAFE489|nr:LOW QUALITY PROTEIN: macrosialin [Hippoglossus stenolepis]
MNRAVVFVLVVCCAFSALSLAKDEQQSNPATVTPAKEFTQHPLPPKTTTSTLKTTTTTPKTTTTPRRLQPPPQDYNHPGTTTTAKTTTTTAKTTTTTAKTTTTTPKTTTTAKTTTTTLKTTTTAKTTTTPKTTTTAKTTTTPKTTTTAKTTTTPKTTAPPPEPTPSTNLTVGNYSLKTDKNVTCLMAHMSLQIRVARPKLNGTFIVQPKDTKAVGDCKGTKANLTLQFKEGHITFMFNKSSANNTVYVNALSFHISYIFSKGAAVDQYQAKNDSVSLFSAKVGHSYSCKAESIYMGDGLYLDVDEDRLQAFNLTKANDFGAPDACPADQPNYGVAIGVGVTLLVLIIIVVVAYILSRRRRTDGYQSL